MKTITQFLKLTLLAASLLVLFACGGGGGGSSGGGNGGGNGGGTPTVGTLGGAAAVGTPIINGTINVICAAGSALTTTTDSTGAWQFTLAGQTLPCAVEVSGGTINGVANTASYHSIAISTGTVNVTPLTDLLVANLVGTANLGTWFAGLSSPSAALAAITQAQVNTALANLSAALPALTPLGTHNPITTIFMPTSGNMNDDMLTALAAAIASTAANVTYADLLSDASAPSFTAPVAGFSTALATAYAGTVSGGGSVSPAPPIASPTPPIVILTGSGGSNISGESNYSLYVLEMSGATKDGSNTSVTSSLVAYSGMGTTATIPYSANNGPLFYGFLSSDKSGNLWAVQRMMSSANQYGMVSTAIVKFPNASSNPASLTPTTIVTLPNDVIVNHPMTFDSSGNLWVDEIALTSTGESASIVEYTAASSYATTGTVIPYFAYQINAGCAGASLAFGSDGHLVALESYRNGSGGCNNRVVEYDVKGADPTTPLTSKYAPSGYPGQDGDLAIDASDNLWVFSNPGPNNCHYPDCTIPGVIAEVSSTGSILHTLSMPSGARYPVLDANGNLWFGVETSFGEGLAPCSTTYTSSLMEIPSGTSTPITAYSYTGTCVAESSFPPIIFWGVAVTPVAPNLP